MHCKHWDWPKPETLYELTHYQTKSCSPDWGYEKPCFQITQQRRVRKSLALESSQGSQISHFPESGGGGTRGGKFKISRHSLRSRQCQGGGKCDISQLE